jgi:hypothetical protein
MTFVTIFLLLLAGLFALAFFTKRRFGVLGLALVAGAMVSSLWVADLTPVVAQAGFVLIKPPLESVVAASLTLLPALLLLMSGPSYRASWQRVMGALLFAVLAAVLLLEPLGSALIIEGPGEQLYRFFTHNSVIVITVCVVLALVDLLLTKTPKISAKH